MADQLPILEIIPELKKQFLLTNTVILQAPPGAGKSTVLPLQLLTEPWLQGKKILMLEPRRLAARSVAERMASLLGEEAGNTVGYRVRFENKTSAKTKLEVLTEGILTRMLQQDNSLEGIGLVIFDEFHERSLHADIALALCRQSQQVLRDDLRILVMSATLEREKLAALLGNAPVIVSKGRQFPVEINYWPADQGSFLPLAMARAIKKAVSLQDGDVLAFLPGAGEISKTQELLEAELPEFLIYPLYGDLPFQKQQEAIMPNKHGRRKIVLATSIAETSLTIEGIKIVVDSGFSRTPQFDPKTGLTRLQTVKVTKDAADQRAGRAGRLGPGVCFRLWNQSAHQYLKDHRTPEIMEADLAPTVLELAQWGIKDMNELAWITAPPAGAVAQARALLNELNALENNAITKTGKELLALPTHPRIAHMLLQSKSSNLLPLAIDIAAILEERDPLVRETGADLTLRVEALRKWRSKEYTKADQAALQRIERNAAYWRKLFSIQVSNSSFDHYEVGKIVAAAYPERIAKQISSGKYKLANGRTASLADGDALAADKWLAIAYLDAGVKEGKIHLAAPLDEKDIHELMTEQEVVAWDGVKGVLLLRKERRLGEIMADSAPLEKAEPEKVIKALCEAVRDEGMGIFSVGEQVEEWQNRLLSLRLWRPEEEWPDVSPLNLLETVEEWLAPYLNTVRKRDDFRKLDLLTILQSSLPWDKLQKMESLVPANVKVPSGSQIKLAYDNMGSAPVLAVRLQEVFGLLETPTVNEGRTKVMLHLLSPGYRPVQITQDLQSFWHNTYPEVRKELKIRYSKHHWPENPWTAEAVRGVKKKII